MAGPILYIAEVDYPAEHSAPHGKWNDWYAHRHAPDLFRLGARSVSSYRPVVGGLAALNVAAAAAALAAVGGSHFESDAAARAAQRIG